MAVRALVTSAGSMPAVAVINALKCQSEYPVEVVAVDMDPQSVGFYLSDEHTTIPPASEPSYIPSLASICRAKKVDVIFPIMDEELVAIASSCSVFESEGIRVAGNSLPTVRLARDKWLTVQKCLSAGIPVPRTAIASDAIGVHGLRFPLIMKPRLGRGTQGVIVIKNEDSLRLLLEDAKDALVQEFVRGQEFTIDVLTDLEGRILSIVPKARLQVKAGMQTKGRTTNDPILIDFAKRVHETFDLTPRANVQCIVSEGRCVLIEVNPKFATSLPLTVAAGVNMPVLLVKMLMGNKVSLEIGEFQDGLMMLRCWREVFVTVGG